MEEWLSPQSLMAIAALLGAAATGITQIWRERRSTPIDKRSADVAAFSSISIANKNTVESFATLTKAQQEEIIRLGESLEQERQKVTLWEHWYEILKSKWKILRGQEEAPSQPEYHKE